MKIKSILILVKNYISLFIKKFEHPCFQAEYVSGLSIPVFLPGGQHGDAPVGKGKARALVNTGTFQAKAKASI